MKASAILTTAATAITTAMAADLSAYRAGAGVEPELKAFLSAYFPFSEDPAATTSWTDWWAADGSITFRGRIYDSAAKRQALKRSILPADGSITWNHVVGQVTVAAETARSKTFSESVIVEIGNKAKGTCAGFKGNVIAEIKKTNGKVDLRHHAGNYLTYVLDLPQKPNVPCGTQPRATL
ncbi:hypothetical protein MCOR14_010964 [Pyricularia oryzae]|nr:hypothetical protein MCOR32_007662 [Pyricularia oryzae]KAI6427080.1 hypothetical protein MCOR24_002661 [Pyricularia oryzae]KAI6433591.1 hypothetical protein MCOR22_009596 [Pyricularia oryzae]KAI6605753.1 hypothetical protein MCOR12_001514 [Pyricularia oryzae]KAI6616635.1 hypothetical protein MCOR14_010964 [Pyricularia oryzae]